jgi:hypothetical protein
VNHLTFVYATYNNPAMLAHQYATWAAYPADLLARVEFIVVDDGSAVPAADVPRPAIPLRLFRVLEDKPWHQDGARNLGAKQAADGWIFFGDMDHVMPASSLRALLRRDDARMCYRFPRRLVSGDYRLSPAVNVYACTREMFWRVGGYDENFCGAYGSDRFFMQRMNAKAPRGLIEDASLDVYLPEQIADCRTEGLERTGDANARRLADAEARSAKQGRLTLAFPWERVA